jgi:hypothetical protein
LGFEVGDEQRRGLERRDWEEGEDDTRGSESGLARSGLARHMPEEAVGLERREEPSWASSGDDHHDDEGTYEGS